MSMAARIRKLYAEGKRPPEIARIVGCTVTYARVVSRQRADSAGSVWDKAYRARPEVKQLLADRFRTRYRTDPKFRERHNSYRHRPEARPMTKAAQIMALHAQGLTTREIALEVYGEAIDKRMAYVRIVVRQRRDGVGETAANRKWRTSEDGRKVFNANTSRRLKAQYHSNPVFRAKALARVANAYQRKKNEATKTTNHV